MSHLSHLIEVKNLVTEFKHEDGTLKAVNDVSYYINEGEIVAFVGESGSGKSVTQYSGLQLIPNARIGKSEIIFEGKNLLDYKANAAEMRAVRGGKIGLIFQEPMTSLNPVIPIGKQLMEGILIHTDMNKAQAKKRAIELMRQVAIPEPETRFRQYPHEFSGGMRQRIVIAMALACNPKLLIADEATTALDVTTQAQILELMKDIVKKNKMSLIIITHNLSIVARYAERAYVMYAGEIVETASINDLFYEPHHPYTIGLLNAVPRLKDPKERKLIPIEGTVKSLVNRKDECAFYNRCPYGEESCISRTRPVLREIGGGEGKESHKIACYKEISKETKALKESTHKTRALKEKRDYQAEEPVLSIQDLKVHFPVYKGILKKKVCDVKAVDGVSFDIYKGETFGLVGESGCGKSTIARTVMKLTRATDGSILFRGKNIARLNSKEMYPIRRDMSMIFQDPYGSLDPRQRASDIVMEPLKNFYPDKSKEELENRVNELFDLVGLDRAYKERVPHEFSGGQRQRLAIARAISTNPQFIVCDEAISALDVSIQAQIINLLEELQEKLGITYLFIAHDLSVVRHISDRVAVMYLGQLVEVADWDKLYDNPLHPYTKALLEAVPESDPLLEQATQRKIIKGEIPSPMNRPKGCAFSTRCPYVMEECRNKKPDLIQREDGHMVACWKESESCLA